jgi:hypothetical protein
MSIFVCLFAAFDAASFLSFSFLSFPVARVLVICHFTPSHFEWLPLYTASIPNLLIRIAW